MKAYKDIRTSYKAMTMKELSYELAALRSYKLDGLDRSGATHLRRKILLVKMIIEERIRNGK